MAIQPIDLQVLFSRMNQLGKEQADQKDARIHTQVVLNAESVKRTEEQDHSIPETRETDSANVRQVKDGNRRRQQGNHSAGDEKKQQTEDAGLPEVVTENYLGKKIDITG
jgi:hypothetical protein